MCSIFLIRQVGRRYIDHFLHVDRGLLPSIPFGHLQHRAWHPAVQRAFAAGAAGMLHLLCYLCLVGSLPIETSLQPFQPVSGRGEGDAAERCLNAGAVLLLEGCALLAEAAGALYSRTFPWSEPFSPLDNGYSAIAA